jgi:hypothetical protein
LKRPLLIAFGLAVIALLVVLIQRAAPSDGGHQATNPQGPNPLPSETIDSYKQRLGASQGQRIDPQSRIVVFVYPTSKNGKCVSLATGLLSWQADHPILTDHEFVNGQQQEADGTSLDLPQIELPPAGAGVNLDYSMYWAPNRALADAAQAAGFKLIDLDSLQNPDDFIQQDPQFRFRFGARWGGGLGDTLDRQVFVPFKEEAQDACDDLYVDQWRHQWDPYMFPGAKVSQKTRINLITSTASSSQDVITFYKKQFPDAFVDLNAGPGVTQINLHRNDLSVSVIDEACSGCTLTKISLSGYFD